MELVFENKYRVRTFDKRNLIVEEYRAIKHKETKVERFDWVEEGFYGKLGQALNAILQLKLKQGTIDTIEKLKESLDGYVSAISGQVKRMAKPDDARIMCAWCPYREKRTKGES